jgi:hypothetical protein
MSICLRGRSRGGARCARVRTGSDRGGLCFLSCRWGWYCWSSGCRQGAGRLPAGEERVLPGPVRGRSVPGSASRRSGSSKKPRRRVQAARSAAMFAAMAQPQFGTRRAPAGGPRPARPCDRWCLTRRCQDGAAWPGTRAYSGTRRPADGCSLFFQVGAGPLRQADRRYKAAIAEPAA